MSRTKPSAPPPRKTIEARTAEPSAPPRLPPFPAPWVELQRDEGPDHQTLVAAIRPPQQAPVLRVRTVTREGVSEALTVLEQAGAAWLLQQFGEAPR